jgi:hypothetical protein
LAIRAVIDKGGIEARFNGFDVPYVHIPLSSGAAKVFNIKVLEFFSADNRNA